MESSFNNVPPPPVPEEEIEARKKWESEAPAREAVKVPANF